MLLAFDTLEQAANVVQAQAWPERAQIARLDAERPVRPGLFARQQPPAQDFVDRFLERSSRAAHLRLQLRGDVLIERNGRSNVRDASDKAS